MADVEASKTALPEQAVKGHRYFGMTIAVDKNTPLSIVWWVVLVLDVLCCALLVTILPQRLRNGIGLRIPTAVLLKVAGVKVSVHGLENVDKNQAQVFVANHQSWFDSFILSASLPVPLTFASKKEMYRVPVYGYIMRRLGFVCVNRAHPKDALRSVDATTASICSGISFVAFPEGTRSRTGELGPFGRGAALLASKACAPIVPITLMGTRMIMRRGSYRINYGARVHVVISKPVDACPNSREEQLAMTGIVRRQIAKNLETMDRSLVC